MIFRKKLPILISGFLLAVNCLKAGNFDHSLFDQLLHTYVKEGLVDYAGLGKDARLKQYLDQLAEMETADLENQDAGMALWINAYNAYTLKLIIDHYPLKSILDIKKPGFETPWKIPLARIGGTDYSLDQIENEILRVRWSDPRIHYGLVCAAQSCPRLRSEAYTQERLHEQLEDQARWFMLHRNRFEQKKKKAYLSQVYEWYAEDFGKNIQAALVSLIPYAEPELAAALRKNVQDWKVTFVPWDWKLNTQP
ncbi:MAG: DUF547 domain-containing protein [Verrucomicrobiae bacterium]|nr:DUF547 domain-containing protein [Verrucomicrobiae bacterium]